MDFSPEKYGPGAMYAYHLMARHAKKECEIKAVVYLTKLFAKKFECEKCRSHFKKITKKYNVKDYATKDKIFEYTVIIHNVINEMLGKRQFTLQEALKIYH